MLRGIMEKQRGLRFLSGMADMEYWALSNEL